MTAVTINGKPIQYDGDPNMPLLWFLRDELKLTGTKFGCGIAMCVACTVHVDGEHVRSCHLPMSTLVGKQVTTIEAVGETPVGKAVQNSWFGLDVVQCGYCQSGQIMSATALLNQVKQPTDAQIDLVMSGNVCRCGTYVRIRAAIHDAAKSLT